MPRTDQELREIAYTSPSMYEANRAAMELLRRQDTLLPARPHRPWWRRVLDRLAS